MKNSLKDNHDIGKYGLISHVSISFQIDVYILEN